MARKYPQLTQEVEQQLRQTLKEAEELPPTRYWFTSRELGILLQTIDELRETIKQLQDKGDLRESPGSN